MKLVKIPFFRFSAFILFISCCLITGPLLALPSGNPADPAMLSRTTWGNDSTYQVSIDSNAARSITGLRINMHLGAYGNYLFSSSSGVKQVPIILIANTPVQYEELHLNNLNISASGVRASVSLQDICHHFVSIWDLEVYGTAGELSTYYRIPMAAFRIPTAISAPTDGLIEVQTKHGFMWNLGAKKIIWNDGNSFLSTGFDYQQSSCPINYVILFQASEPEVFIEHEDATSTNSILYKEWAANVSVGTRITENLIPYASLSGGTLYLKSGKKSNQTLFSQLTQKYPDLQFTMRKIKSYEHLNLNAGISYIFHENASLNVEGTWGSQTAVSFNFRFQL